MLVKDCVTSPAKYKIIQHVTCRNMVSHFFTNNGFFLFVCFLKQKTILTLVFKTRYSCHKMFAHNNFMHTFLQFGTEPSSWAEHITLSISLWKWMFLIYDCPLRAMLYCRWAKFMRMTAAHIQRHLIHLSPYTPTLSYIQQPAPTQPFNHTSP